MEFNYQNPKTYQLISKAVDTDEGLSAELASFQEAYQGLFLDIKESRPDLTPDDIATFVTNVLIAETDAMSQYMTD